jgi:hypothetical protein
VIFMTSYSPPLQGKADGLNPASQRYFVFPGPPGATNQAR